MTIIGAINDQLKFTNNIHPASFENRKQKNNLDYNYLVELYLNSLEVTV